MIKRMTGLTLIVVISLALLACHRDNANGKQLTYGEPDTSVPLENSKDPGEVLENKDSNVSTIAITPTAQIETITDGFMSALYYGDYGFDEFLQQGGAITDEAIVEYLMRS